MATLIRSDLEFILQQILISEAHAAGTDLSSLVPNAFAPFGLRTVDGSYNNLVTGQSDFGSSDQPFPTLVPATPFYPTPGSAVDPEPRIISNLVADMTSNNPAAVQAYVDAGLGTLDVDGNLLDLAGNPIPVGTLLTIPNVAPDVGLSAPFNSWFTFFGQFFDHGLDLVNKSSTEIVMIPLQPDDPLFNPASPGTNFMIVSRVTRDADGNATNQTTPFVDQNQTYTSHPSHQVFLREYVLDASGKPVATGSLLDHADGGLATWLDVKEQARTMLGIELDDMDILNLPLLATDQYGKFIPDPVTGFAQVVVNAGPPPLLQSGTPGSPIDGSLGLRTGHAFLDDIAHTAKPVSSTGAPLTADADGVVGGTPAPGQYDDELLDRHFITGDGRGNENIALTAVHHVFHSEHNRQVDAIKATVLATGDADFIASWLLPGANQTNGVQELEWNGERLFQAARFATEMQYQHLVFEEFARKLHPTIDEFLAPTGYDATINPAIFGEFAHAVYRLGHSMLTESIDRLDPNFVSTGMPLLDAFLNPVAFNNDNTLSPEAAAGAIVRGMTRQVGNEIDEFVTDAVRNTLLGLPLDLAAINIARGRDTGIPTLNEARREFHQMTGDSQLKPYTSWADLAMNLKHEASVVNFIAAYGTHAEFSVADVDTVADRRAVAVALVLGGPVTINAGTATERILTIADADRIAFLNSTGAYANLAGGITTTGVDDIDLWIGGLAERTMPFGGMLGSTFAFVFETQLESLQNGDRFYYLSRLAGLNFLTEMENNSFAKLVMLNTDTTHLPADIFSTPAWILEADPLRQFTGLNEAGLDGIQGTIDDVAGADGITGNSDPDGGSALVPLVIRDDPSTPGADANYLHYTGPDHVVLGGTAGNDTLIASEGDDTIWGDGGNDRIEGGFGNDNIEAGDGDDIVTDQGGDDVLKGNGGNDVIQGGNGLNLILGGDGNDFIITGEDVSDTFGGAGNDFILGAQMNLPTFGNEGDDWIEIGTSDGAGGDNFDPAEASTVIGHDVFLTGGGFDEVDGEGGDDIMVFSDGEDHFGGGGGFDWASYEADPLGVKADLLISDRVEPPVTASNQGVLDRFAEVEGLSGSAHNDFLRGDNADQATIASGDALDGSLTNVSLYNNLQALLGAGVTTFNSGNILLGGGGSDILEGRGGDDLIDGDRWINVRVSVRANADGTGPEIRSVESLTELVPDMLSGAINPGQLQIVREILTAEADFDTALFSGNRAEYTVVTNAATGVTTVTHNLLDATGAIVGVGIDGIDTLKNIERLQFNNEAQVLAPGLNAEPVGALTFTGTPAVNQVLTASAAGILDADNISPTNALGTVTGPIAFVWQAETLPGSGLFQDIVTLGGANPETAKGNTLQVTAELEGFALRVRAVYEDGHGVLENVYSAPTAPIAGTAPVAPPPPLPAETPVNTAGIHLIRSDLQFILDQIKIGEANSGAYGTPSQDLSSLLPNSRLPFGLRTVDGTFNNLVPGQTTFGSADQDFPSLLDQVFRNDADGDSFDANGPAPGGLVTNTNYATTTNVADNDPRIISNLISDQTAGNAAAVAANGGATPITSPGMDGIFGTADDRDVFFIPNTAPDAGLSAPFNAWFTFFGQFFDHGLDLVDKGGNGTIFIPLEADDPLVAGADGIFVDDPTTAVNEAADNLAASQRFMVVTRATNSPTSIATQAGADGILNTADDVHFHNNQTTPFVDQNQTYTSHASHQVFLREYETSTAGRTVATGRLIDGAEGGIGNWAEVKAQAAQYLGIQLTDMDVLNVPLLATDAYGKFIPGPNGFAQVVTNLGLVEGVAGGLNLNALPGGAIVARTGHPFLADIAHTASPVSPTGQVLTADADNIVGGTPASGQYDNELLDKHFITGDGRGNENIGLTAVHFIFHAEHNRLVDHIKEVILASNDPAFIAQWHDADGSWNGERLFQAARFGTEMQYQHLVFEEFARKVQPQVDVFLQEGQGYDSTIDPAIVAEFAHVVYRFGHSMLTETVDRYDPSLNLVNGDSQQLGLIAAFLNPLEYSATAGTDAQSAGAIVRGVTRQAGNEIDEFVTEALRNNLLGLPLDLPAINIARGRDTGVPTLNQARAQFFEWTGDSQLKPYESWSDFGGHLKHEESLVNFVAAYGTHTTITGATTLEARRAAAYALVYGANGLDGLPATGDEPTTAVPADRLAFLNGPAAITGVNGIDLWIGGLAEEQMPFGGLLGSTFNYVFENQMEKLQNGDRFYYLERTAGLNFLTELENNTFAKLISANTDATHLPGDVFSTPGFTLEVDPTRQLTGLGLLGRDDPAGDVIRDNPQTPGVDTNHLQYTGDQHVVLGGTGLADVMIASEGDDTLYGDGGNDQLEGGYGNDMIFGGAGDDIITDTGGDDNLQGGDGNDAINGGQGIDLILGGFGNDFIVNDKDEAESFGGTGNDFILGSSGAEMAFGNEGDDWLELGMADGSAGENFDTRGLDAIVGNDVFMGDSVSDRMLGEGGDDIMVGNGGQLDRYIGNSGFDWASFDNPHGAATADLNLRAFNETAVPLSVASTLARFESVEGLSGSAFSDLLLGDDANALTIPASGFTGSVLTNFALINGLQAFVNLGSPTPVTSFSAGNIILGGDGSDIIEGRGGDDLIDGDRHLNVRISVRANPDGSGGEIGSADTMSELVDAVFAGTINPGQLVIVREILPGSGGFNFDTAVFSGAMAEYTIAVDDTTGVIVVTHNLIDVDGTILTPGGGVDGTDRLTNIERLQFADVSFTPGVIENEPVGLLTVSDDTPVAARQLTVSAAGVTDADNVSLANPSGAITGLISYVWQVELRPGSNVFQDIITPTGIGDLIAGGTSFTPGSAEEGLRLRVKAIYQDANGVLETVFSAPTAAVAAAGADGVTISDTTPTETQTISAVVNDLDGIASAISYQWQQGALGGGGPFTNIVGATNQNFTPGAGQVNRALQVVASYTDGLGNASTVTSLVTVVTGDVIPANAAAQTLDGTQGQDIIAGGAGADTLNGRGEDDNLSGGLDNDVINAAAGNDSIAYAIGDGADAVDGGLGIDTLNITGTAAGETLNVTYALTTLSGVAGGTMTGVEIVTADLQAGIDTLSYAGSTDGVTVDLGSNIASGFTSLAGVENVTGGSGNDVLAGVAGAINTLAGGAGNDTFVVHDTGDIVSEEAGGGTDLVRSVANTYTLSDVDVENLTFAGTGNFTGTGNAAANVITGGGGNDTLFGMAGNDTVNGGVGSDTLDGGLGNDTVNGGAGDDTLVYVMNQGTDVLDGGTGLDRLHFVGTAAGNTLTAVYTGVAFTSLPGIPTLNTEAVSVDLAGGSDTLSYAGTTLAVTVDLGAGTASGFASIAGIEGAVGGSGNDLLIGSAGVVNGLTGGAGNDTFVVQEATDVVIENAGGGTDEVRSLGASYTLTNLNVENLTYIGAGSFTGTGNAGANVITGGGGADVLSGVAGNDTLNGGNGGDTLVGGLGNDAVNGGAGNDTINWTFADGTDAWDGGTGVDAVVITGSIAPNTLNVTYNGSVLTNVGGNTIVNVEQVVADLLDGTDGIVYTTTANVTVDLGLGTASGFARVFGVEQVVSGSGNDTLTGAAGVVNALAGGLGNDVYVVHESTDTAIEAAGAGTDEVRSRASSYALGINVENLTFIGAGSFTGTGNLVANVITGGGAGDTLSGGQGNDTLIGNAGADTLNGDLGDDNLSGGIAADVLNGGDGNDLLDGGTESDTLSGGNGNDTLLGGAGNDGLNGDAGIDVINGGAGNDVLTGGLANDTFVFQTGFGADRITDFDAIALGGQDRMDISGLGITAATFGASVSITLANLDAVAGLDTLVTIGTNSIALLGVNGVGDNAITAADFIMA